MIKKLTEQQFNKILLDVDNIMINDDIDLKYEIYNSSIDISDILIKKAYYHHMNTLFLNVLLNRLNEFVSYNEAEKRALNARQIIYELIQNLKNEQV